MRTVEDYFAEYAAKLFSGDLNQTLDAAKEVFVHFQDEIEETTKKRALHTPAVKRAVIAEANRKWNRLVDLFKNRFTKSPLRKDAVLIRSQKDDPELWGLPPKEEPAITKADVQGDGMSGYEEDPLGFPRSLPQCEQQEKNCDE